MSKSKKILAICLSTVALTACSANTSDLDEWMEAQKNAPPSSVVNIAKPIEFIAETYNGEGLVSPFDKRKLRALRGDDEGFPACFQAQVDRRNNRPGDLEPVPLDVMNVVGYMSKKNLAMAMIQVDGVIYEAYVGEYIGPNYGKITSISESNVYITETLLSPDGQGCEEKTETLVVQGGTL